MEKLFEAIDKDVLTDELKSELEQSFNEAVELKATEIASAEIDAKIEEISEKAEEFKAELVEKQEAADKELLESLDGYLTKVVEEFVAEAKDTLDDSITQNKADMLIEAMETMIIATGVDMAKIVESKEDSMVESKLEESVAKYDTLVEENIAKDKEINSLLKKGIIAELSEDLTMVEATKFEKLAALVEFSKDEAYLSKLDTIKESVKGAKADKIEESLNEDVNVNEPSWKRFV